jgi:hypothetical protein
MTHGPIEFSAVMRPACPPDPVGIPFRLAIPLNMVNLPPGTYRVAVLIGSRALTNWPRIG